MQKAEDNSVTCSAKAREKLRSERFAASQKVASVASKERSKRKVSEAKATELTKKLRQEQKHVATASSLLNVAITCKQETERGVVRSTDRRFEEKYRHIIEELQDNIKSSNVIINQFTMNLQQKDKEIEELKGTIQVRLPSLIFFFYSLFTYINVCFSLSFLSYLG